MLNTTKRNPVPAKSRVMVPSRELIQHHNRELGLLIQQERLKKQASVATCASLLGISRRRYSAMENGDATTGYAELQVLLEFFGIKMEAFRLKPWSDDRTSAVEDTGTASVPGQIWLGKSEDENIDESTATRQIEVQARAGEELQIVIEIIPEGKTKKAKSIIIKVNV